MSLVSPRLLGLVAMALALPCWGIAAQDSASPSAEMTADTVDVAEVFELRVRVPVPAGSAVFFPDTLIATTDIESFGPVEWDADRAPGDGAVLTLVYPLIPFGSGTIGVPGVDIVITPAALAADGEGLPGGSRIGAWEEAPRASTASILRTSVPERQIRVRPAQTDEDILAGVNPRGPDDVVGPNWSWPAVGLLALFSSTLVGAGVSATRSSLAGRKRAPAGPAGQPQTSEAARLSALAEIDRLLADRSFGPESSPVVYEKSSEVVRGYVERLDPTWGPELTSTELMARLRAAIGAHDDLAAAMLAAERVKFGRLRPASTVTEAYLRALRDWLSERRAAA